MNTRPILTGSTVRFARASRPFTQPAPGVVGPDQKPDATDDTFRNLGVVADSSIDIEKIQREIHDRASLGVSLVDVLERVKTLRLSFTLESYGDEINALAFGSASADGAGGTFNIGSRRGALKGWLKFSHDDVESGQSVVVADVYVALDLSSLAFPEDGPKPEVVARVLHSTLNVGTLAAQ